MVLKGKSVFGGIAIGRLAIYKKGENIVSKVNIDDPNAELLRFDDAKKEAKRQLGVLYKKALEELGEENAAIFEVHQMMLDDMDFYESVEEIVRTQKVCVEYAISETGDRFSEMFASMDDEYMKARAVDVKDISDRVLAVLQGTNNSVIESDDSVILVANDLAPSETVQLDKSKVLSFVTRLGSTNSHTAILARTMNIPALIGIDFDESINGNMGIVDGEKGLLIVDPNEETISQYIEKQKSQAKKRNLLQELKGKETVTKSGKKVSLFANIGSVKDVESVLQNDGEGVGLFRSEFLYLESNDYPSEEEQFKAYSDVAKALLDKKVIIRTLDIGADKQASYFHLPKEENPELGMRAIRICLEREDIFMTQIRAILRASIYGNISVMYPMITSIWEIQRIKAIVDECKLELKNSGVPYKDIEQGVMIETPAAVFISEELAKEVDFFSIGTNDLTQYLLAIDRQNPNLDEFYDPHHPAVLRAIRTTIENGHKAGIWVGICGELASDLAMTREFIKMGVDELSVSSSRTLEIRAAIRDMD